VVRTLEEQWKNYKEINGGFYFHCFRTFVTQVNKLERKQRQEEDTTKLLLLRIDVVGTHTAAKHCLTLFNITSPGIYDRA
jgi:hypothetical protein